MLALHWKDIRGIIREQRLPSPFNDTDSMQARSLLEALIDKPASFHALTFNLSTIYELCTEYSRDRKMELADRVATHKPSQFGWEKSAADFKL